MRLLWTSILLLGAFGACAATTRSVKGTATYRERLALPPNAVFEVVLEDVSRADAPAETIARVRTPSPGNPPFAFELQYDPKRIRENHHYSVRARVSTGDGLLFTTDQSYPVLTRGHGDTVSLMLKGVAAAPATPSPAAASLQNTRWTLVPPDPSGPTDRPSEAHFILQPDGRVTGSDGCNRVMGTYKVEGEALSFGPLATTRMACPGTQAIERRFHDALSAARRFRIADGKLELQDESGKSLARFEPRP